MKYTQFSLDAIREIYDSENRKGNIDLGMMPESYREIVTKIHEKVKTLNELLKIRIKNLEKTEKEKHYTEIKNLKKEIAELRDSKECGLTDFLKELESRIQAGDVRFDIECNKKLSTGDKEFFQMKERSIETMIFSKLICRDLATSFKVKPAARHHIVSSIKLLLDENRKWYIIRTDIKSFYESIHQERLKQLIKSNPFLSPKTKRCVLSVLHQYEGLKTKECSKKQQGVPRGISISALLSEIYMREFDIEVKRQPNVLFYARYVDDIFILYSNLLPNNSLEDMWLELATKDSLGQMELHCPETTKTSLVKYDSVQQGIGDEEITYLGYTIKLSSAGKKIKFSLSQKRYNRIKERIDNAFSYFEDSYKFDLRRAHKTLIDCLNLLSGNVSLRKSKCGLKTGLYYSNDLLTDLAQLKKLTGYLHRKVDALDVEKTCFSSEESKTAYLNRIKFEVKKVKFEQRWEERKTYSFKISEMRRLSKVLNNEKEA